MQEFFTSKRAGKKKKDDNNNNIVLVSWSLVGERVTDVYFWTQWLSLKAMVASNWTNYRTIYWSSGIRVPRWQAAFSQGKQTWLWSWLPFNNGSWVRIHYLCWNRHCYINSSRTSGDGQASTITWTTEGRWTGSLSTRLCKSEAATGVTRYNSIRRLRTMQIGWDHLDVINGQNRPR